MIGRLLFLLAALVAFGAQAETLTPEALALRVEPPYELGERLSEDGVWSIRDRTGLDAGYIFETEPLAPLPGFSGAPINALVTLDKLGNFLRVDLLAHNEPVFVSGLGEAPFHAFMRQYRGLSIFDSITVGVPYGANDRASAAHTYLDGVTKATASVRIAHESILAASLAVARERMQGLGGGPTPSPLQTASEVLTWDDLVAEGIARRRRVSNAELQAAFAGSLWAADDPVALADPEGDYLDLWIVDVGPLAVAQAVLDADALAERAALLAIAPHDELILLLANGRHRLVSDDFVRNTSPDLFFARQHGLPVALRDADILIGLAGGVPDFEQRMMIRADRRLGFDPTLEWELTLRAVRLHGSFMPERGVREITATYAAPERFFARPEAPAARPVWVESLLARRADLIVAAVFLAGLGLALAWRMGRSFAGAPRFFGARLAILAFVAVFIGWWGQGQLSIVTVTGALRTAIDGASFAFLLYDPFSLLIWIVALAGLILWGRGLFCGWLCPYGALQEFSHAIGRALRLPSLRVPEAWDRRLKMVKYGVLAALIAAALFRPALNDALAEVEPFKTAITVGFDREWGYVVYAAFWLALGLVVFKSFCRYLCPLGAFFALGGWARRVDWIKRRTECGTPCQLCKVRCEYNAIDRSGGIDYGECFQCLECVRIHDDPKACVPLILAAKRRERAP